MWSRAGRTGVLVAGIVLAILASPLQAGQIPTAGPETGPQLVWTCPMHGEIIELEGGICPICRMDLVSAMMESAWVCPIHEVVMEDGPGTCRICLRDLMPVTVGVTWACPNHPDVSKLLPGTCPIDGVVLEKKQAMRPHENHTPQHGGVFFMAPDNWHHVEGTYPEPGVLRLYVYDNFSKLLDTRQVTGRVVLEETYDPAANRTSEVEAYALVPSDDGSYLEARVGNVLLPAELTAKVALAPSHPEDRFDFVFAEHSSAPDAAGEMTTAGASMGGSVEPFDPLADLVIPGAGPEIASEILTRSSRVKALVDKGAFTEIFIPALEAKELGLALEAQVEQLSEQRRSRVIVAIRQLVRAAYLLDWYGDLGNREQVTSAYVLFDEAVSNIASAYSR